MKKQPLYMNWAISKISKSEVNPLYMPLLKNAYSKSDRFLMRFSTISKGNLTMISVEKVRLIPHISKLE